jgi:hypothetical protein
MTQEKQYDILLATAIMIIFIWLSWLVCRFLQSKQNKGIPTFKNPPLPPKSRHWLLIEKLIKDAQEYENKGMYEGSAILLMTARYQIKMKRKELIKKQKKKKETETHEHCPSGCNSISYSSDDKIHKTCISCRVKWNKYTNLIVDSEC